MPDPLIVTKVSSPMLQQLLVSRTKVLRWLRERFPDAHLLAPNWRNECRPQLNPNKLD
jgi:hypothetical protein